MITRLPALPLIAQDPYFSVWMPADTLTDADTAHWCGASQPMHGTLTIDGTAYRFLGLGDAPAMKTVEQSVTPTATTAVLEAANVRLTVQFVSPLLLSDLDRLSTPITLLDCQAVSLDGKEHQVDFLLHLSDKMCYDPEAASEVPEMIYRNIPCGQLNVAFLGQNRQKLLCHSGDHITIDWGYLYMASAQGEFSQDNGLALRQSVVCGQTPASIRALLAYDDVASVLYFGHPCKAWYARNGKTLFQALAETHAQFDALLEKCRALDEEVLAEAGQIGGENYQLIVAAAWRHTLAAHKLIADPDGKMVLLSKENDSNGCMGTVDVSYPSTPIFLRFCPELVNALCRPVLKFASMPVWTYDFAPHDVGRYPIASGQVYSVSDKEKEAFVQKHGAISAPLYLYPATAEAFKLVNQMPVEECGNMLIMLYTAVHYGADWELIRSYRGLMDKWVKYLEQFGRDPGEQLCTDDFAGHLNHNINLAAKAIVGIACYGRMMNLLGEDGSAWEKEAREMAQDWLARAKNGNSTYLTFDQQGWSMKYNLCWDVVLDLGLLPREFYREETDSYLPRINRYGLPLDSRADYTKSDWEMWCATMAENKAVSDAIIAAIATYLKESKTRVAFSDWYFTSTGDYRHFIARSVQGGLFMPYLKK